MSAPPKTAKDAQVVVFDLETQDTIDAMPGSDRADQVARLQVSVACAVQIPARLAADPRLAADAVAAARKTHAWRDDNSDARGPFESLLELFDDATLIVGYNVFAFDWLVLRKHYRSKARYERHLLKTHDAFSRLKEATGRWFKLDALLGANALDAKTANGLEAIRMWEDGRRDELLEYCQADVLQTARLLLLPELRLPGCRTRVPNHVFGIAAALASVETAAGEAPDSAGETPTPNN